MPIYQQDYINLVENLKILIGNSLSTKASKVKINTGYPLFSTITFWNDDLGIPESQHTGFIAEDATKPTILNGVNVIQLGKMCQKFIVTTTRRAVPIRYKFSFIFSPGGVLQNIVKNQFEEPSETHYTEIVFQTIRLPITAQIKANKGIIPIEDIMSPSVENSGLSVEFIRGTAT